MEIKPGNSRIVALTGEHDDHIPYVERHLDESRLIVVDPEKIMEGDGLSYQIIDGQLRIVYMGEVLDDVKSVWYRKPRRLTLDQLNPSQEEERVPPRYQGYAIDALNRHYDSIRAQFPDALWVSDYYDIMRASQKPRQLAEAARLHFKIPDTLFTSDPQAARQFVNDYPVTVTKQISTVSPMGKNGEGSVLMTRIVDPETIRLSDLPLAPSIFQEAITDIGAELRVTVVGDKVFPAVVDGSDANDPTIRDWRVGYYTGNFKAEAFDKLPSDIAESCVALTKRLGLQYGAIDLIIDKQGKVWFIEINPNGQWVFIEDQTKQPIGRAIADLLEAGHRK